MKKTIIGQPAVEQSPIGAQETGAEIDWEKIKQEKWLYRNFFESLKDGVWRPTTEEEIEQMVDERLFTGESITPLSKEQELLLRRRSADHLLQWANRSDFKLLIGDIYYQDIGEKNRFRHHLYLPYAANKEHRELQKLSPDDKAKLFLAPEFWFSAQLHRTDSEDGYTGGRGLLGWGNRNMKDYGLTYAFSESLLNDLIKKNNVANILDIGSGIGLALHELKQIYGNKIETSGLSLEQEIGMFPADHQYYSPAERFPKELNTKFDLIFSNMAFLHFLFQNIALGNVVRALRSGGMAEIHFSYEAFSGQLTTNREIYSKYFASQGLPADHYNAMEILVGEEVAKLERLHNRGLIDLLHDDSFSKQKNQGIVRITKKVDFDYDKEE